MVVAVGVVIIGGIRRIASTAEKIVPLMCGVYVVTALAILGFNADKIAGAFGLIFSEAFKWESAYGGMLGVMVVGIKRAAFSNEAGIGSAAIAHSAVKTDEPVTEGFVALLEPFIDTVVICTMTALVIVTTVYDPALASTDVSGIELTATAFASTTCSSATGASINWSSEPSS